MPPPIVIDKAQARRFLLAHLRLLPPRGLHGKQGVLDYIRHVNCIQYDPINVVGQNPHLGLQSRVHGYKPAMLDALLHEDRKLVDGFDKMMSIYPVEDWPEFASYRERMVKGYMESEETAAAAKLVDGHLCYTGNMARALIRLGYGDDRDLRWSSAKAAGRSNPTSMSVKI